MIDLTGYSEAELELQVNNDEYFYNAFEWMKEGESEADIEKYFKEYFIFTDAQFTYLMDY